MSPLHFLESFVQVPDVLARREPRVGTFGTAPWCSMELDVGVNGLDVYGKRQLFFMPAEFLCQTANV